MKLHQRILLIGQSASLWPEMLMDNWLLVEKTTDQDNLKNTSSDHQDSLSQRPIIYVIQVSFHLLRMPCSFNTKENHFHSKIFEIAPKSAYQILKWKAQERIISLRIWESHARVKWDTIQAYNIQNSKLIGLGYHPNVKIHSSFVHISIHYLLADV